MSASQETFLKVVNKMIMVTDAISLKGCISCANHRLTNLTYFSNALLYAH